MSFIITKGKTSVSSLIIFCLVGLVGAATIGAAYSMSIKESNRLIAESELINQDLLKTLNWLTFTNKLKTFQIKYPRSWRFNISTKKESSGPVENIVFLPKDAQGLDYAIFVKKETEEINGSTLTEQVNELRKLHPDHKDVENNQVEGIVYIENKGSWQALKALMVGEDGVVSLVYAQERMINYSVEDYERYEGVFLRLLSTFRFL